MKQILIITFLAFSLSGFAQVFNVQDSLFPTISFEWREYGMIQRTNADFSLTENEQRNPTLQMVELPDREGKNVLFLWEDMAVRRRQFDTFREVLNLFFDGISENSDRFNAAVFNRRPFDNDASIGNLRYLSDSFVPRREILNRINDYQRSTARFTDEPARPDLYASIETALNNLSNDGSYMIVLMTSGFNVSARLGRSSQSPRYLISTARERNIPIFVVYYPHLDNNNIPEELNNIASGTNAGQVINAGNTREAANRLIAYYRALNMRTYRFTFETEQTDAAGHREAWLQTPSGRERITFDAPPQLVTGVTVIKLWIQGNLVLFICLLLLFIALVVLAVWFIIRYVNKRKKQLKEEIDANNAENQHKIDELKRQQAEEKHKREAEEKRKQAEKERKAREAEEARLLAMMQTKNLFPRLLCQAGSENFTYNIGKIYTTIGRKGHNNDVEFDSDKVSRKHAEIIFTGGGFDIIDKGSTNKVIINGQFFQRATLKNGDIIGLGEVVITFYV